MSGYAEHAPPPPLREHVLCGWTLTAVAAQPGHRVLPDGCMDIVVAPGRTRVAGPATTAFAAPMPAGSFAAGVRFRPGAAPALLGVAAHELRDDHTDLDRLWPRTGIDDAQSAREAMDALWELLLRRAPAAPRPDPQVRAAVRAIARDPSTPIADIAQWVALSERQLRRRFDDHVGHGPKVLARVVRLRTLLATDPADTWARRAAQAGYADQAHMTRECRALAGVTPTLL